MAEIEGGEANMNLINVRAEDGCLAYYSESRRFETLKAMGGYIDEEIEREEKLK